MNAKDFRESIKNTFLNKGYTQLKSPGFSFLKDEPENERVIWLYTNSKNNFEQISMYRLDLWIVFTPISDILGPVLNIESLKANRKKYNNVFGISLQGENNLIFEDGKFHKLGSQPKAIELFNDPIEALNYIETVYQEYYVPFIERMNINHLFGLLEKEPSNIWSNSIDYCTVFAKLILTHKFNRENYIDCMENVHELIQRKEHLKGLDSSIYFGEELDKYDNLINELFTSIKDKLG